MKNLLIPLLTITLLFFVASKSATVHRTDIAEEEAIAPESAFVKEAILDYVEGIYYLDTSRIHRSVHPKLVKRGSWFDNNAGDYVPLQEMSFQQLINLTKSWNKDGKRANPHSVRDIVVYDVQDKTATAKLTAVWGTDYFHLAKLDGRWYIMNILWQSPKPH